MPNSNTGELPKRQLGSTGLFVHPIGIGCAPLGSMPETMGYAVDEEQALATLRAAFVEPINFIDTAGLYGDGEAERRIGIVLREMGGLPPGFVLATKAGRNPQTLEYYDAKGIRASVERSLRLLGLDRLQLLYLHGPDRTTWEWVNAPGGPLEAFVQLKREGVAEHLGVAGGATDVLLRYLDLDLFEVVLTHNHYNLLSVDAGLVLDVATKKGLGVVNAAPYGSGILAKGPDEYPRFRYEEASQEIIERARLIQAVCRRYDVPLAAVALQFSLRDSRITSTVAGMTKPERVAQTVEYAKMAIPEPLWEELRPLIG
ncbi:MAG: aldo/keto reductase [Chloroflexota bacterium]